MTLISRRSLLQAAVLMPGLALGSWPTWASGASGFTHGVASGDPNQHSVVLWTRFVPQDGGVAQLRIEVADDARFTRIVVRGVASAGPATDHCAHAIPVGLRPGRWFFYRFKAPDGSVSEIGRTRTLPVGSPERFRIGVVSCANATSGWFNAYAHAAAREDLHLIIHTGDYIYESPIDRSDAIAAVAEVRDVQPRGEAVSLADYRLRYASYRSDPSLMELHRRFPWIAIWDDHEVANNSWKGGAANHDAAEGPWDGRAAAGVRAFREWLPMRPLDYGEYQIGDLATIFRLETRLLARSKQLEVDPGLLCGPDPKSAVEAFKNKALADPRRTLMGAVQEKWLADGLAASTSSGTRWQVLAQQVIVASTRLPNIGSEWLAPGATLNAKAQAGLEIAVALSRLGLPMGLDRWDGYPAGRSRLLGSAAQARAHLVVLSGDSHNAWAYDLAHEGRAIGVEFAGHSVSSLGIEKRFGGDPAVIARDFVDANPQLAWCDTSRRGYMLVNLSRERVSTEWLFLPSLDVRSTDPLGRHILVTERGSRRLS